MLRNLFLLRNLFKKNIKYYVVWGLMRFEWDYDWWELVKI